MDCCFHFLTLTLLIKYSLDLPFISYICELLHLAIVVILPIFLDSVTHILFPEYSNFPQCVS